MACATNSIPNRKSEYSTIVNVRNIDEEMTDETLKELFAKYGTLTSYKVMSSNIAELGRFAYVAFEDPDAAEEAIIELNGQELATGRRIALRRTHEKIVRRVTAAKPENLITTRKDIIVNNLNSDIDENYLRQVFKPYGTVTSSKIIKINGRSKGYGFVTFATSEEAVTAVQKMNRKIVMGRGLYVNIVRGTDHSKSAQEPGIKMDASRQTNHIETGTSSAASVPYARREPAQELRTSPSAASRPVVPRCEPMSSFARDFFAYCDSDSE